MEVDKSPLAVGSGTPSDCCRSDLAPEALLRLFSLLARYIRAPSRLLSGWITTPTPHLILSPPFHHFALPPLLTIPPAKVHLRNFSNITEKAPDVLLLSCKWQASQANDAGALSVCLFVSCHCRVRRADCNGSMGLGWTTSKAPI